jgi:predicted membrane protein
MKMNWFSLFVGVFFVLLGLGMILRIFGIDLHLTRVAFALFIIYLGVRILVPGHFKRRRQSESASTVVFSSASAAKTDSGPTDYSAVFGSQKIDLTRVDLSSGDVRVSIRAAFGGAEVTLDPKMPVKITADAAFAGIELPEGSAAALGTQVYKSPSYKDGSPALLIDASAAFGGIEFK